MRQPERQKLGIRDYQSQLYKNPFAEAIRACDLYGQPISMNFENRQSHQTIFGGLVTLGVFLSFFIQFSNSMLRPENFYLFDTKSATSQYFGFEKPQPAALLKKGNETQFSFIAYVDDPSFDNDDNPYGKFILHMYTNMNNISDTIGPRPLRFYDKEVPLEICSAKDLGFRQENLKFYCPAFNESHWIHGGFSADMVSNLRLAIHACDDSADAEKKRME